MKPEILRGEIEILQTLAGKHYCLAVVGVYEAPKTIYLVTELCSGGEMMEYVAHRCDPKEAGVVHDLRTEDVSRISFQLLSAVAHCEKHQVIHRDIKPENVMFVDRSLQAELRLIDFGSGCIDANKKIPLESRDEQGLVKHTTVRARAAR
jgi:serine/threonine protein kinase